MTMRQNRRKGGRVCVSQNQKYKSKKHQAQHPKNTHPEDIQGVAHGCSILGFYTIQKGKKTPQWL